MIPIKNGAFEERLKQLEEKMKEIESIFDYEDETQKNDCEEEKSWKKQQRFFQGVLY